MEFYYRSITTFLDSQNEILKKFQEERFAAKQENEKGIEEDIKSQKYTSIYSPKERRESFEKQWDSNELSLYKDQLKKVHERMIAIDNELHPGPEYFESFEKLFNQSGKGKDKENQKGHSR